MSEISGSRLFGCAFLFAIASCVAAPPALATLTISKKPTKDVTCSAGVCTATAKNAVLNVTDLTNMLATTGVTLESGKKAHDIDFAAPVAWGSSNGMVINSYTSITFEQPFTVQGTAAIYLGLNDGGSGGVLSFSGKGSITFWDLASHFEINGTAYTLVRDVAGLASAVSASPGGAFALAASYNAKPDGTYKAPPVTTYLAGPFEGLGNTISNLKIAVTKAHNYTGSVWKGQVGLFAGVGGTIENVGITNAKVSAPDDTNAGILVGELSGTVANSYATGSVLVGNAVAGATAPQPDAGGLVGAMFSAVVSGSYSSATVVGGNSAIVGGLAGLAYGGGEIVNSYATGSVTAGDSILGGNTGSNVGGLVGAVYDEPSGSTLLMADHALGDVSAGGNGSNYCGGLVGGVTGGAQIMLSYARGAVSVGAGDASTSSYGEAGGLIGGDYWNSMGIEETIQQSYATGAVLGAPTTIVGGLMGYQGSTIADSYATGSVSAVGNGFTALGGFAGYIAGSVSTSYSTGAVQSVPGSWVGGFAGGIQDIGVLSNDYWDADSSGITDLAQGVGNESNAPGVTGLTTAQFQSGLPAGFSATIWGESGGVNGGFPYLLSLPPGGQPRLAGFALPKPDAAMRPFIGMHLQIAGPRLLLKK